MAKYFDGITQETELTRNKGGLLNVPDGFLASAAQLIAQCSSLQGEIQNIIYVSHGAELIDAGKALKDHPNPKARLDFLCKFPFHDADPALVRVFDFARSLFREIYELRNVLAHENWGSSDHYPGAVLFTSLDEESRLSMASGRLWHYADATPRETYEATVRFIRRVKNVRPDQLILALSEASTCSWVLMTLSQLLNTAEREKREQTRRALAVFGATAHLFDHDASLPAEVEVSNSKSKMVTGY